MIELINVTKEYGKLIANDNISFKVKPSEISILVGENGAGKSTLIKSIVGLLRFKGDILLCGKDNKSKEAKRFLGYVQETPVLYNMLTAWEHMEFISRAYSLEIWEKEAKDLFERFNLIAQKDKLGKELSKGMKQKVSICCALLIQPKILLLDEPFIGLDPHAIKELKKIIVELKNKEVAILISTHLLDSVSEFWDSVNVMEGGKIIASKKKEAECDSNEDIEELFFKTSKETQDSLVEVKS